MIQTVGTRSPRWPVASPVTDRAHGSRSFPATGRHTCSQPLKVISAWPVTTLRPHSSNCGRGLKIDRAIPAKSDHCAKHNEWDMWEHHLYHSHCTAHTQIKADRLEPAHEKLGFRLAWKFYSKLSPHPLLLFFVSNHDVVVELTQKRRLSFVKGAWQVG